jgi:hypothetical protein
LTCPLCCRPPKGIESSSYHLPSTVLRPPTYEMARAFRLMKAQCRAARRRMVLQYLPFTHIGGVPPWLV